MVKIKDLPKSDRPRRKYPGAGHRGRLRNRFLQGGIDALLDYEIVELLLTLGTPLKDCKQMAKEAIKMFEGLQGVLDASYDELRQIKGIGPSNAFGIKLFRAISEKYAREKLPKKTLLDSPQAVVDYLREKIGKEKKEHFLILSLDTRNYLIRENIVSVGTLNANLVHPREVFKEAIDARADLNEKLSVAMEKLNPNYRTALLLRYNDHFTFREIAESLGEPLNTVKSRHRRALIMLKKEILNASISV